MTKIIKNEHIISFVISVLIVSAGFIAMGIYPFGEYTFVCSDMQSQFLDLTAGIFNNIKSGKNIFVTWSGGMGINLYSWSTYLLFNPLNILFLFFDTVYYQEVYLAIIIIKFGLVSLFASVYFKNSNYVNLKGRLNVAFAVLYAFGIFSLKSIINVMWLDNVALLPIVMLGIEKVIEKRKAWVLFFSFLLCLATNFYLAYMTGIFSFIYFVFYYINCAKIKNAKHILTSVLICGVTVLLTAGLCMIILLPNWVTISSTYEDLFEPVTVQSLFSWTPLDVIQCLFFVQKKSAVSLVIHGFFGTAPLFFGFLFLINNAIPKKERICAFIWMFFMLFSLMFTPLYLMWHIFRNPVCFYGRFVYTVAFLFIMLAAKCVKEFHFKSAKPIVVLVILMFLAGFYGLSKNTTFWLMGNFAIVMALIVVYAVIAYVRSKKDSKLSMNIMTVLITAEAAVVCFAGFTVSKEYDNWIDRNDYAKYVENARKVVNNIEDDSFYRVDDVGVYSFNSGLSAGYNCVTSFSSFTNQKSLSVLNDLGLTVPYDYRISANYTNNIVMDGLLNNKYIIATNWNNKHIKLNDNIGREIDLLGAYSMGYRLTSDNYEKILETESGDIYLNKTAFPTMFSVNEEAIYAADDFLDKSDYMTASYRNQAALLNSFFGTDYKLYEELEFTQEPEIENAKIENQEGKYDFFDLKLTNLREDAVLANEADELGRITYKYKADKSGEYYLDSRIKYDNEMDAEEFRYVTYINGFAVKAKHTSYCQLDTPDIGYYNEGDEIEVQVMAMRDLRMAKPILFRLNEDEFEDYYNRAWDNALQDIKQVGNDITAVSDFDEERLVFSTISYDQGFTVYIDGEEADKVEIASSFLGFRVPAGKHNIVIKYVSPGFVTGRNISIVSLVLAVIFLVVNKKMKYVPELYVPSDVYDISLEDYEEMEKSLDEEYVKFEGDLEDEESENDG